MIPASEGPFRLASGWWPYCVWAWKKEWQGDREALQMNWPMN